MKIAAGVEYQGSQYSGWQKQKHSASVQEHVEAALSAVADHPVEVTCAGRTDAGVHALNQVIHFESDAVRDTHSWVLGANTHLPEDISLVWAKSVEPDFHARYSATSRSYKYIILNRSARPGISYSRVTWECRRLMLTGCPGSPVVGWQTRFYFLQGKILSGEIARQERVEPGRDPGQ